MNPYQLMKLYSVCKTVEYEPIYKTIFSLRILSGVKIIKIVFDNYVDIHGYPNDLILPDTLLYFTMGTRFNNWIELPNTLLYLTTSTNFNQPLVLPNNLLYLDLGVFYNQPIRLPDTLLFLRIKSNYTHIIVLPNSLLYLDIKYPICGLKVLPNKLRFLACNIICANNWILPETLETIILTVGICVKFDKCTVKRCIDNLPNTVKTIGLGCYFEFYPYFFENMSNQVKYILGRDNIYCLKKLEDRGVRELEVCGKRKDVRCVKIGENEAYVLGEIVLFEMMGDK